MKRTGSLRVGGAAKKARTSKILKRKTVGFRRTTPQLYAPSTAFPNVLKTVLRYDSNLIRRSGGVSQTNPAAVRLNSLYDFDNDNVLDNKQPLYFDTLVTATGPYRSAKCDSWSSRITVINNSTDPLQFYWCQADSIAEIDSNIEIQNRPGVQRLLLAPKGSSGDRGIIKSTGSMYKIFGDAVNPVSKISFATADPATVAFGTYVGYNPNAASVPDFWVSIQHDFSVELSNVDGTQS